MVPPFAPLRGQQGGLAGPLKNTNGGTPPGPAGRDGSGSGGSRVQGIARASTHSGLGHIRLTWAGGVRQIVRPVVEDERGSGPHSVPRVQEARTTPRCGLGSRGADGVVEDRGGWSSAGTVSAGWWLIWCCCCSAVAARRCRRQQRQRRRRLQHASLGHMGWFAG